MSSPVIQFKRGQAANIGIASFKAGEPGFTTDKYDFYIGLDGTHTNQKFFGSSRYWNREDGTSAAQLKFVDKDGSNSINFQAPNTLAGIGTWILPDYAAGSANQFLKVSSVSGNQRTLNWATVTTTFDIAADSGTNDEVSTGSTITFAGTANEIETTVTDNQIQIGLTTDVTIANNLTVTNNILVTGTVDGRDVADDGTAIDNLVTLTGVATNSTHLGTFSGTTINDNQTVKAAIQALETSLEAVSGGGSGATSVGVASTNVDSTHYITFVDGNNSSKTQEDIRTDAGITYNPSSNLLTLSNLSIAGVAVTAILDEDDLSSNRADALATQQSIKQYVDSNTPAGTVDISGDTGTASVSTGATFAFTGTNPVNIAASGAGVTFSVDAASNTNPGISSFSSNDFDVTSGGLVTLDGVVVKSISAGGDTVTPSENAFTIAGTDDQIETSGSGATVTVGLTTDVVIANNLTVTNNLYVNGSTTQVNVDALTIDDPLIAMGTTTINDDRAQPPNADFGKDLGILMHYYTAGTAKLASVYWDNSEGRMVMADVVTESNNVLTATSRATVEIGSLMLSDAAGTAESVITVSGTDRILENIIVDAGSF